MSDPLRFTRLPLRQSDGKENDGGAFTDPVFDDEYYGRDQAGGKARTIGLAVGVLVGAAIAGTAAWFVFGPGGAAERGQTPLIVAEPEPFKVRPEDPGGLQVDNQDKRVYERLNGDAGQADVENILPPPEAPRSPAAAPPVPQPHVADAPPPTMSAPAATLPEAPASAPTSAAPPTPAVAEAAPAEQPPVNPAPAVVETEPMAHSPATPEETRQPPDSQPMAEGAQAEPAQTLESMVAALSGDYLIQIAALRSEDAAMNEWNRVSGRYPALLGSYRPLVVRADLGERSIFYRLRAGPLANRSDAEQLCTALAAENVGCLVVRNE